MTSSGWANCLDEAAAAVEARISDMLETVQSSCSSPPNAVGSSGADTPANRTRQSYPRRAGNAVVTRVRRDCAKERDADADVVHALSDARCGADTDRRHRTVLAQAMRLCQSHFPVDAAPVRFETARQRVRRQRPPLPHGPHGI